MTAAKLLWSRPLNAPPVGMVVAREAGSVLVWDADGALTLIDQSGRVTGQQRYPGPIHSASISDDGTSIVVTSGPLVSRFSSAFRPASETKTQSPIRATALDVGGEYCVSGEESGRVAIWARDGRLIREWKAPRPPKFLALLAIVPHAIVAAELGFIGRLDLVTGEWVWRDRPVIHLGSLSVDAEGTRCALACFSEGVRVYGADGKQLPTKAAVAPKSRFAAVSANGTRLALIGVDHSVTVAGVSDGTAERLSVDQAGCALGLSAIGDTLYVCVADSRVCAYALV